MRVDWVQLVNMKSFADSGVIELGPVNVFVGPNNAGKSTVLRALRLLQDIADFRPADVRIGAPKLEVRTQISGPGIEESVGAVANPLVSTLTRDRIGNMQLVWIHQDGAGINHRAFPAVEPLNLLYHYLSKRKVVAFEETVNLSSTTAVASDLRHLTSKVVRLANPATPAHEEYMAACRQILGFPVTEFASPGGQKAGRIVSNFDAIALEDMGEGVASLVGLIVDLCVAEGKVFLVEEPENDLHPKALKALLDLMARKAQTNQFVVSTHSNIVARHLGALPDARLFRVDQDPGDPMATSTVRYLGNDPAARIEALADLGYELYDFDLFDGWLILEESSAERIVRDYLVPWFVPRLTRVRTLAAGGASKVGPTFEDFHRLFRFTHLEARYRNRAYVVVDGDAAGQAAVERLRETFPSWDPECFGTFPADDFERYYPDAFRERVSETLDVQDRKAAREAKRALLKDVIAWIEQDRERAQAAFEASAADVIETLQTVDRRLFG